MRSQEREKERKREREKERKKNSAFLASTSLLPSGQFE
jgi:hypothetical protein